MLTPSESLMFLEKNRAFRHAGVITKFAERLSARLPPIIYGNGDQTRDFIFVDDVVSAIVLCASVADKIQEETSTSSYPSSYSHILNDGKALKIRDLAQMMIKIFDLDLEPVFTESRTGDIVNSLADISRLKIVLDFGPSSEIEPCLKQMFKH